MREKSILHRRLYGIWDLTQHRESRKDGPKIRRLLNCQVEEAFDLKHNFSVTLV
jgi:hypothetical protein